MERIRIAVIGVEKVGKTRILDAITKSKQFNDVKKGEYKRVYEFGKDKLEVCFDELDVVDLTDTERILSYSAVIYIYNIYNKYTIQPILELKDIPKEWKEKKCIFFVGRRKEFGEPEVLQSQMKKFCYDKFKRNMNICYVVSEEDYYEKTRMNRIENVISKIIEVTFTDQYLSQFVELSLDQSELGSDDNEVERDIENIHAFRVTEVVQNNVTPKHIKKVKKEEYEDISENFRLYEHLPIFYPDSSINGDESQGNERSGFIAFLFKICSKFCDLVGDSNEDYGQNVHGIKRKKIRRKDYEELKYGRPQITSPHK